MAHCPERESFCSKLWNEPRGGVDGVPLILERRRLVAVVHHHDVTIRDPAADAPHRGVGGARAEPVPIPQHPAPAHHPMVDFLEPPVHRPAPPARVRTKGSTRTMTAGALDVISMCAEH